MKKNLYLLLGLTILLMVGCGQSSYEDPNVKTEEDLTQFLLNYEDAYCDQRKILDQFWKDYYSPTYTKIRNTDGTDIPTMQILGKTGKDRLELYGTTEKLNRLKEHTFSSDFNESLRRLDVAYTFLQDYLNGNSSLTGFDEFKTTVTPKMLSFNETIEGIPDSLSYEFEGIIYEHSELDTDVTRGALEIETMCDLVIDLAALEDEEDEYIIAYIDVPDVSSLYRNDNGAFNVYGTTSENCKNVTVSATNYTAGITDNYKLEEYSYGDTSFRYGIREDWNNVGFGTNTYTFTAYCDDDQVVTDQIVLTLEPVIPSYSEPTYNYNYDYNYNDFDSYNSNKTFNGYECTDDCSGHEAGYEWAEDNDIYDIDDCDSYSNSFTEGCESYVEEVYGY